MARLSLIAVEGLPLVRPGDDLPALVLAALAATDEALQDGDVVVFAQKIVSKAEGRYVDLADVVPGAEALRVAVEVAKDPRLVEVILSQSRRVVRMRRDVLIVEHALGLVMANAGVDHSNVGPAGDRVLLLPIDPDASAAALRAAFARLCGRSVGVIINDSFGRAWRQGTMGVAIGVAGVPALLDRRGDADLFGHALQSTVIGHADELAAAASVLMGPAAEGRPVVIIRGVPAGGVAGRAADIMRPAAQDLFR